MTIDRGYRVTLRRSPMGFIGGEMYVTGSEVVFRGSRGQTISIPKESVLGIRRSRVFDGGGRWGFDVEFDQSGSHTKYSFIVWMERYTALMSLFESFDYPMLESKDDYVLEMPPRACCLVPFVLFALAFMWFWPRLW